MQNLQLLVAA